jgi:hypothetical protein
MLALGRDEWREGCVRGGQGSKSVAPLMMMMMTTTKSNVCRDHNSILKQLGSVTTLFVYSKHGYGAKLLSYV